jgi:hypothetical protein
MKHPASDFHDDLRSRNAKSPASTKEAGLLLLLKV